MVNAPSCRIWNLCRYPHVYLRMPGRRAKGGIMKTIWKVAMAVAVTGAIALTAATPSEARYRHRGAGIGLGIVAGALVGSAIVNNGYYGGYYGPGYYGPGYYGSGYYGPGPYAGPYAYEPAPVYMVPRRVYRGGGCWHSTDSDRGFGYYGACN
jgi:hypothetical protein